MMVMEPTAETMLVPFVASSSSAEEIKSAHEVQMTLLRRRAPNMATLEYGGCYLPAREVGGDYFDFIHLGLGRMDLVVGDISGKGVPAALMMASLQAILRSHSSGLSADLVRPLRSVNRLFCECTGANSYASLFIGDYSDATRSLRYANCGHQPPLVVHRDFSLDRLESTATVLGMFPDWECLTRQIALKPGDTLLMFTDGVTEAMNEAGEEFGETRLVETLQSFRDLGLADLVRELGAAVRIFSGGRLRDDLTLLVARPLESI